MMIILKEDKENQAEIQEFISGGIQDLDEWEQNVHKIGVKSMQELFKSGIELHQEQVLSEYIHRRKRGNNPCHTVKRGFRDFTLRTVFGKVRFPRQRMFCQTCGEWVVPINHLGYMMMSRRELP